MFSYVLGIGKMIRGQDCSKTAALAIIEIYGGGWVLNYWIIGLLDCCIGGQRRYPAFGFVWVRFGTVFDWQKAVSDPAVIGFSPFSKMGSFGKNALCIQALCDGSTAGGGGTASPIRRRGRLRVAQGLAVDA